MLVLTILMLMMGWRGEAWGMASPDAQFTLLVPDGWKASVLKEGEHQFYIMLSPPPGMTAAMQAMGDQARKGETLDQVMQRVVADLKGEYPDYAAKNVQHTTWHGLPAVRWIGSFKHEEYRTDFQVRNLLVLRKGKFYRFAAASRAGDILVNPTYEKWIESIQWKP